jgi:hypothetical protein
MMIGGDVRHELIQPSLRDWNIAKCAYPTLKRWASLVHPSGTQGNAPIGLDL